MLALITSDRARLCAFCLFIPFSMFEMRSHSPRGKCGLPFQHVGANPLVLDSAGLIISLVRLKGAASSSTVRQSLLRSLLQHVPCPAPRRHQPDTRSSSPTRPTRPTRSQSAPRSHRPSAKRPAFRHESAPNRQHGRRISGTKQQQHRGSFPQGPARPQINIPAWVFRRSWCANFEFRGGDVPACCPCCPGCGPGRHTEMAGHSPVRSISHMKSW